MQIYKFKTSVSNEEQAKQIVKFLEPFYFMACIDFKLTHPDKVLTIESMEEENHNDIVIDLLTNCGFTCEEM